RHADAVCTGEEQRPALLLLGDHGSGEAPGVRLRRKRNHKERRRHHQHAKSHQVLLPGQCSHRQKSAARSQGVAAGEKVATDQWSPPGPLEPPPPPTFGPPSEPDGPSVGDEGPGPPPAPSITSVGAIGVATALGPGPPCESEPLLVLSPLLDSTVVESS